jgi:CRP/FNR family transcriptional regulator, cyclic AMP receptor protein
MSAQVKRLKVGETLISEGQESTSLYYLQKGSMEVTKRKGNVMVKLGHIFSGELVGEMSFLDKGPRSATVIAKEDCELLEIPAEKFQEILDSQPTWMGSLINTLLDRLRRTNARIKI